MICGARAARQSGEIRLGSPATHSYGGLTRKTRPVINLDCEPGDR